MHGAVAAKDERGIGLVGGIESASEPQSKGLPRAQPTGPLHHPVTCTCDQRPFVGAQSWGTLLLSSVQPIGRIMPSTKESSCGKPFYRLLLFCS